MWSFGNSRRFVRRTIFVTSFPSTRMHPGHQRSHKPAGPPSFAVAGLLYTQLHCAGLVWDCRLAFFVLLALATLAGVDRSEASLK